jgi:hypothetical protein
VVKLATDALDVVRREVWNDAPRAGQRQLAKDLKGRGRQTSCVSLLS